MVIDHRRLQGEAWAAFHTARKRLEKVARDLHQHETVDIPAYETWLHRTFPILLSTLRETTAELEPKAAMVREVQARAALFGGSLKRLWRELKAGKVRAEMDDNAGDEDDDDDEFDFDYDDERDDEDEDDAGDFRRGGDEDDGGMRDFFARRAQPAPTLEARDIYRRLVQRLHPDRGGEWTPARERLWHEVQTAWAAGDADWLSRLEIEWEAVNDILSPDSPLSRLRQAIEELHGARRDTESKLREYRRAPAWRFTKNEKKRPVLHQRVERLLRQDLDFLQGQLEYINATIAAWEEDWTRPRRRR